MTQLLIADVAAGAALPALTYEVTATRLIAGALASRDYSPLHHDRTYVVDVAGQRDIFANTQFQAALIERYLGDWSGPLGRIARMQFRMKSSIFAGDRVLFGGVVEQVLAEGPCGASAAVNITLSVEGRLATTCEALYALPASAGDNPWVRRGMQWLQPD